MKKKKPERLKNTDNATNSTAHSIMWQKLSYISWQSVLVFSSILLAFAYRYSVLGFQENSSSLLCLFGAIVSIVCALVSDNRFQKSNNSARSSSAVRLFFVIIIGLIAGVSLYFGLSGSGWGQETGYWYLQDRYESFLFISIGINLVLLVIYILNPKNLTKIYPKAKYVFCMILALSVVACLPTQISYDIKTQRDKNSEKSYAILRKSVYDYTQVHHQLPQNVNDLNLSIEDKSTLNSSRASYKPTNTLSSAQVEQKLQTSGDPNLGLDYDICVDWDYSKNINSEYLNPWQKDIYNLSHDAGEQCYHEEARVSI